ncbi:hypothetical protein TRVL_08142 [Trypanosoma vivax]|nr:hypothetical protein TRVL_08142 [Trypanosoma vivax]
MRRCPRLEVARSCPHLATWHTAVARLPAFFLCSRSACLVTAFLLSAARAPQKNPSGTALRLLGPSANALHASPPVPPPRLRESAARACLLAAAPFPKALRLLLFRASSASWRTMRLSSCPCACARGRRGSLKFLNVFPFCCLCLKHLPRVGERAGVCIAWPSRARLGLACANMRHPPT